jgi:hypothetical protein
MGAGKRGHGLLFVPRLAGLDGLGGQMTDLGKDQFLHPQADRTP